MARAHTVWMIMVNGKPTKAFTVKHEARTWLEGSKGWNIYSIFRMPDGQYPLFAVTELTYKGFMDE